VEAKRRTIRSKTGVLAAWHWQGLVDVCAPRHSVVTGLCTSRTRSRGGHGFLFPRLFESERERERERETERERGERERESREREKERQTGGEECAHRREPWHPEMKPSSASVSLLRFAFVLWPHFCCSSTSLVSSLRSFFPSLPFPSFLAFPSLPPPVVRSLC